MNGSIEERLNRAAMPETYDSVTTDLRPAAFDQLRDENTTLATETERLAAENAELREAGERYRSNVNALLAARNDDADRFLRRIERLRRAVVRERQNVTRLAEHLLLDHEAMDRDAQTRDRQSTVIRTLSNQRTDLLGATRAAGDALLIAVAERDEARRAIAALRPVSHGE